MCSFFLGLQHVQGLWIINPFRDYSTPALQNQNSVASLLLGQPTGKRYLFLHIKRHMPYGYLNTMNFLNCQFI